MVQFLKRIWQDISQGESIDVYVLVVLAIILAVSSAVEIVPINWIAPVTLGVLALLAVSILGNRYRLEEIRTQLFRGKHDVLLREFVEDILQEKLDKSAEIWFVGGTLSRSSKKYYATVKNKLKKGACVKMLLGNPDGITYITSVQSNQSSYTKNPEEAKTEIGLTLKRLCELRKEVPSNLEIRVLNHTITQGIIAIDPEMPSGSLYIEYFPFKMPQESLPKLVLHPEDEEWYDFFRDQLYAMWENGRIWEC